ncbi:tudor domain-containing protein 15 [Syngnathus scovelli]|uniref:tudor domain-containing protein 15 n=1 Tax=Syngnathus scovelli TaxID=161590 RepID=UPI00210FFDDE|nr:tudor domain-containing protein 15 [Syngnathus scovelli]XP_049613697.1 tudor domain-containing protein 15 [Syngnathus scovelli]
MHSLLNAQDHRSQDSSPSGPCALMTVDLKLSHLDWNPEATLIHFQGQYRTLDELDYKTLQREIQNVPKIKANMDIGELCLVEDARTAQWYRGRFQGRKGGVSDIFLIDHGNVLSVEAAHISSCSKDLFNRPAKIVCGFLANVLLHGGSCHSSGVADFLSSLIGKNVTGYIQAVLPHRVLLLDVPDINDELVRQGFGKHVDKDTFLLLVELLTEVALKQNINPIPDLLLSGRSDRICGYKSCALKVYEQILPFCGPRMSCGTRARLRLTAAVNPGLFYCQMVSKESDLLLMSKKLAAVNDGQSRQQKTQANVGLLCSAKSKNGKWYRGSVQFLPMNSQAQVLFVDFGFSELVKVEDVRSLPPDLYSTAIMAFPCSLASLKVQDEELASRQLSFLKAGLLGAVLDVLVDAFDEERRLYSITLLDALENHTAEDVTRPHPKKEEPRPSPQDLSYESIVGRELAKTLKREELQERSVFEAVLEFAQNPNDFWIRTTKRDGEFQEMMSKIAHHFAGMKLEDDVLLNPELGALCCALYEADMQFYRGVVTGKLQHGAEVLFIDFGNVEKVPGAVIKKIPEALASIPAFALCCTLVNVMPVDDVWTRFNLDFFRATLSGKLLLVHVVQITPCKCVVDLYEVEGDGGRSVSELMAASQQADYWKIIPEKHQQDETTKKAIQDSRVNGKEAKGEDKCDHKSSTSPSLEKRDPPEEEEEFIYSHFDLTPEHQEDVYVTHISDECDIYCQLYRNTQAIQELEENISAQIQKTNAASAQDAPTKRCLAKYLDGNWYRALVLSSPSPRHLNVFFVDYGNCGISEKANVVSLPRDCRCLVSTPIQALKFNLACVSRKEVNTEVKEWLEEALLYKRLRAVILAKCPDSSFDVRLLDGDLDINQKVGKLVGGVLVSTVSLKQTTDKQPVLDVSVEKHHENLKKHQNTKKSKSQPLKPFAQHLGKVQNPQVGHLPDRKEKEGSRSLCYVSHVDSLRHFFLQLSQDEAAILKMAEDINSMSESSLKPAILLRRGDLVLARYHKDGTLYRAIVGAYHDRSGSKVNFLDYGNSAVVEEKKIYALPGKFLLLPPFAIPCCLADSGPYDDAAAFTDAVVGKPLMVHFVRKRGTCWQVEMDILKDEETSKAPEPPAMDEKAKLRDQAVLKVTENQQGTFETCMKDTNLSSSESFKTKNKKRPVITRLKKKRTFGAKVKVDLVFLARLRKNQKAFLPPLPESHNQKLLPEPSLHHKLVFAPVSLNKEYSGFIGSATTPSEFYVVLKDSMAVVNKVTILLERLSGSDLALLPKCSLTPGAGCLFRSDLDKWCRAEVVRADDSSGGVVNLVDRGLSNRFAGQDLRIIPEDLLKLPKVVYPCVLRGARPGGEDGHWSEQANIYLQKIVNRNLKVLFRELLSDTRWAVDITVDGVDLAQTLVAEGFRSGVNSDDGDPTPARIRSSQSGPSRRFW